MHRPSLLPWKYSCSFLTLCMWCIIIILTLTDQHFCTFRCILDRILIIAATPFDVLLHHLPPVNCKSLQTPQIITSTRWSHATGSNFCTKNPQLWIIIKSSSLTCMCNKVVAGLDQFSHRMQHSEYH
jgi:hypothetical protein